MTIKVTYNVTDVYMTQSVSPVYINVSYSGGGTSGGGVWGTITGTLSNQTDLQNALNAKFDDPTGDTTQYIAGDGSLVAFPITGQAGTLVREVRNNSGATITKGTVVYINGASGNRPTIAKAIATTDATSAQTFGLVQANITNNSNGYIVAFGDLDGLDTSAYTEGAQLYLSSTVLGGYTITKQYAPAHLVYIGVVTRSHPNQGRIEVRIQNGYEMDELHDVAAQTPSNNDGLFYNSTNSLWENKSIATALGYTPANAATTLTINGVTYDLSTSRTWTISAGISGTIASGQVAYGTAANTVGGSNNLFWDAANSRLGIGTNAPSSSFEISTTTGKGIIIKANSGALNGAIQQGILNGNTITIDAASPTPRIAFGQSPTLLNSFFTIGAGSGINFYNTTTRNFQIQSTISGTSDIRFQIFANTGNLVLQNGGTFTDSGQRLQVYGDTLLRGSGNTSATTALTVQNSASTPLFNVRNDGAVFIQSVNTVATLYMSSNGDSSFQKSTSGTNGVQLFGPSSAHHTLSISSFNSDNYSNGALSSLRFNGNYVSSAGSTAFSYMLINATINQTGTNTSIVRGLYVNPTLTSAADFRAIETARGNIVFSNLPTSSAGLPSGALWNNGGVINIV